LPPHNQFIRNQRDGRGSTDQESEVTAPSGRFRCTVNACYKSAIMKIPKTSRRTFLGSTAGAAAIATQPAWPQNPQGAGQSHPGARDSSPRACWCPPASQRRGRNTGDLTCTRTCRRFFASGGGGPRRDAEGLRASPNAIAGWMDTLNIRTMVNLTGGFGDLLKQKRQRLARALQGPVLQLRRNLLTTASANPTSRNGRRMKSRGANRPAPWVSRF